MIGDNWYSELFKLIADRCTVEELPERLASIAFIDFNYDRCIEHYLFHAIQRYYSVDQDFATQLLTPLKIHHPFGVVGRLPWQQERDTTAFGYVLSGENLLAIANSNFTISDSTANRAEVDAWGEALGAAQTVVFLGFGFHEQNMALLVPAETSMKVRKQVFATAHDISDFDRERVINSIKDRIGGAKLFVRSDLKCAGLFREFSSGLTLR